MHYKPCFIEWWHHCYSRRAWLNFSAMLVLSLWHHETSDLLLPSSWWTPPVSIRSANKLYFCLQISRFVWSNRLPLHKKPKGCVPLRVSGGHFSVISATGAVLYAVGEQIKLPSVRLSEEWRSVYVGLLLQTFRIISFVRIKSTKKWLIFE